MIQQVLILNPWHALSMLSTFISPPSPPTRSRLLHTQILTTAAGTLSRIADRGWPRSLIVYHQIGMEKHAEVAPHGISQRSGLGSKGDTHAHHAHTEHSSPSASESDDEETQITAHAEPSTGGSTRESPSAVGDLTPPPPIQPSNHPAIPDLPFVIDSVSRDCASGSSAQNQGAQSPEPRKPTSFLPSTHPPTHVHTPHGHTAHRAHTCTTTHFRGGAVAPSSSYPDDPCAYSVLGHGTAPWQAVQVPMYTSQSHIAIAHRTSHIACRSHTSHLHR